MIAYEEAIYAERKSPIQSSILTALMEAFI